MKTNHKVAIVVVAGAAIGVRHPGLHAHSRRESLCRHGNRGHQSKKRKTRISEVGESMEVERRNIPARGGKIVSLEGGEAPKRATIVAYDSLKKPEPARNSAGNWPHGAQIATAIKARRGKSRVSRINLGKIAVTWGRLALAASSSFGSLVRFGRYVARNGRDGGRPSRASPTYGG